MKFPTPFALACIFFPILTYKVVSQEKPQKASPEAYDATEVFPDEMPKVSGRVAERKPNGWWIVSDDGARLFISKGAILESKDTDFVLNEYVSFLCYNNKTVGELMKEECARMNNLYNWIFYGDPIPCNGLRSVERPVYFAALSSRPERNSARARKANEEFKKLLHSKDGNSK